MCYKQTGGPIIGPSDTVSGPKKVAISNQNCKHCQLYDQAI